MLRGRVLLLLPVFVVASGCGDDDHVTVVVDGGIIDAGPAALVHTTAPSSSLSLPGPNSATFAMSLGADGVWTPLAPRENGLYAVPFHGDRWTAAFVCADDDNAFVAIYDRAANVTDFSIDLGQPCSLEPVAVGDLTGTFAHAPPATSWFDFGYIAGERGSSLPLSGENAEYELVNLVSGKWDLVFGFRDDSFGPLTKVFIMRDEQVDVETTLDADLAAAGVAPGTKALTITGLAPDEELHSPVIYAMAGGPHGIDMGPPSVTGPNLTFATVPSELQRPTDKYRLTFTARLPDDSGERGAHGVFHDAVDITLDLPPALPAPSYTNLGSAPYLRLSMKTAGRANAATYELAAVTEVTDRRSHRWTYSTDVIAAEGADVAFDMPDFSAVQGWNNAWTIQPDRTSVTATVLEKTSPLADGTLERFASHTVPFTP